MNPFKVAKALFTSAPRTAPLDCAHRIRSGEAFLVDVREPDEWNHGVVQHAVLLPLSDLTGKRARWNPFLAGATGREILVYCASGGRSGLAARLLANEGFQSSNTGGMADWAAAGWPVVKPARH